MAVVFNGTKNSLPSSQIPEGYTRPEVTTFTDYEYTSTKVIEVDKGTVDNADPAVTMANIIDQVTEGLNDKIEALLGEDFDDSANVITAYADLTALRNNMQSMLKDSPVYTTADLKFQATVKIYIKTEPD